jgi:hypothetical protein
MKTSQTSKVKSQTNSIPVSIFFNACFDKSHLKNLVDWFLKKYGEKRTVDFIEKLKQLGFYQATQAGISLGLEDLQIPLQKSVLISEASSEIYVINQNTIQGNITNVEKSQRLIDTWNQTSDLMRQSAVQTFRTTNCVNPVYMMAFSGARGNISQVRQLVAMRGLMADPQGAILEFPIQSNFREGLTITEYLISCYGARKGLVDTALRTATSGYLTRRLVDAVQHVVISIPDCGTRKGILISGKTIEHRLIGRVLAQPIKIKDTRTFISPNDVSNVLIPNQMFGTETSGNDNENCYLEKNTIISPNLSNVLANNLTQVLIRSPLTCEAYKSVCQFCYGSDLAHGTLVNLGEAVGVIAAQSIGEPGTQLTMRTFHTGGVGVFSEQTMKPLTAPFAGKIQFLEELPGHFVRTPHGKIVYIVKYTEGTPHKVLFKVISPAPHIENYSITEQNLPTGSLLLVKHGEFVSAGQLLAQASRLKRANQKLPESTHLVCSPNDGEIFFESLVIAKPKQVTVQTKAATLRQFGTFWVFASENHREPHTVKQFFMPGDRVDLKSILFQYNLYVSCQGQLRKQDSKISVGAELLNISFNTIRFHKNCYSLILNRPTFFDISKNHNQHENPISKKKNIIYYKGGFEKTNLVWYPNSTLAFECSYVCVTSPYYSNGSQFSVRKKQLFDEITTNIPQVTTGSPLTKLNTFCQPRGIVFIKTDYFKKLNIKQKILKTNTPKLLFNKYRNIDLKTGLFRFIPGSTFKTAIKRNIKLTGIINPYVGRVLGNTLKFSPITSQTRQNFDSQLTVKNKDSYKTILAQGYSNSSVSVLNRMFGKNSVQSGNQRFLIKNVISSVETEKTLVNYRNQCFVEKALTKIQHTIYSCKKPAVQVLQNQKPWIYVPSITGFTKEIDSFFYTPKFIATGKKRDKFIFPFNKISIECLDAKTLSFISLKKKKYYLYSSVSFQNVKRDLLKKISLVLDYNTDQLIDSTYSYKKLSFPNEILGKDNFYPTSIFNKELPKNWNNVSTISSTTLFYTRLTLPCFSSGKSGDVRGSSLKTGTLVQRLIRRKQSKTEIPFILVLSSAQEYSFPQTLELKKRWNNLLSKSRSFQSNSPLFNKQSCTLFTKQNLPSLELVGSSISKSGWISPNQLFRVYLNLNATTRLKRLSTNFGGIFATKNQNFLICNSLILFFYTHLSLQNTRNFIFKTFCDGWVFTTIPMTKGFIRIKAPGEFRKIKSKQNEAFVSILRTSNTSTFVIKTSLVYTHSIGQVIRRGEQVIPGVALPESGQILNISKNSLTLRLGTPYLGSTRGILHITHEDLVRQNDLLVTLKSRRLQTEDIVQGIPKIEQLFEARETQAGEILNNTVHKHLQQSFVQRLETQKLNVAVEQSVQDAQLFLVENIIEAYANQGVKIAEKHVEVVVRQMTSRVRILSGGATGFLAGEIVQLAWIEQINDYLQKIGGCEAAYEPIVLGISKSVLQSESFLLAASFQEVSRVLVRSALTRKTDFLKGLHENVILGQLIPAGTGLLVKHQS